jgi:hypothetical protein
MLKAAELASMRSEAEKFMLDTMTVLSRTVVFGQNPTYTDGASHKCRLRTLAGREAEEASRVAPKATAWIVYPSSVALSPEDRLRIGDKTYQIAYVAEPTELTVQNRAYLSRT